MSAQWCAAKCLYKAVHSGAEPPHEEMFEYRLFLLRASNEVKAHERAVVFAKECEHSYKNQYGSVVEWKLEAVADVKEIVNFEVREGVEVYSEYFTRDDLGKADPSSLRFSG